MMITTLAKVVKLAWTENAEFRETIPELLKICQNPITLHVALQTLDDLILEMGCVQRGKVLVTMRRISLSFRDTALHLIFEQVVNHV
jgi:hypothetical protein